MAHSDSPPASVFLVIPALAYLLYQPWSAGISIDTMAWYPLLSFLFFTLSLQSLISTFSPSCWMKVTKLLHFWSSKDAQVISTWIFCWLLKCYTSQTKPTTFLHWYPYFSLPLELSELFNEITILLATSLETLPSSLILLLPLISCPISNWLSNSISFTYKRLWDL